MNVSEVLKKYAPQLLDEGGALLPDARESLERVLRVPEGSDAPWILRALSAFGMWVGAGLIGMIVFAMDLQRLGIGAVLLAFAAIGVAAFLWRTLDRTLAMSQLVWALVLGGHLLAVGGLTHLEYGFDAVLLVLAAVSALTFAVVPMGSLRVSSVVAVAGWLLAFLFAKEVSHPGLFVASVLVPFGVVVWAQEERIAARFPSAWTALAPGLPVAAGVALAVEPGRVIGIVVALLWLGLAHLRRSGALHGLSILQLLGFLFFFYYELSTPLLEKSVWVMASGAVLVAVALVLRPPAVLARAAATRGLGRRLLVAAGLVALCGGAVGFAVVEKMRLLREGRTVLLKLAPVDPRSLIQGDYMRLDYEVTRALRDHEDLDSLPRKGTIVVALDESGVASFRRLGSPSSAGAGEIPLEYRVRESWPSPVRIGAEEFFFEEGQAAVYERAEYGELVVDSSGGVVLVGLRDSERKRLGRTVFDSL